MQGQSTKTFIDLLSTSGVLSENDVSDIRHRFQTAQTAGHLAANLVEKSLITFWQAKLLLSGKNELRLGPYILLNHTKKNELGDRFSAVHRHLKRHTEIQLFPPPGNRHSGQQRELVSFATKLAQLDHPHLQHLLDINTYQSRHYLVFELETGVPLPSIDAGVLSESDIAAIVAQCLDALQYAHSEGTCHGQLTADQIRWTGKRPIKISDLGLASMIEFARNTPQDDAFTCSLKPSADFFSLSAIGNELLLKHTTARSDPSLGDLFRQLAQTASDSTAPHQETTATIRDWKRSAQAGTAGTDQASTKRVPLPSQIAAPVHQTLNPPSDATFATPPPSLEDTAEIPSPPDRGQAKRIPKWVAHAASLASLALLSIWIFQPTARQSSTAKEPLPRLQQSTEQILHASPALPSQPSALAPSLPVAALPSPSFSPPPPATPVQILATKQASNHIDDNAAESNNDNAKIYDQETKTNDKEATNREQKLTLKTKNRKDRPLPSIDEVRKSIKKQKAKRRKKSAQSQDSPTTDPPDPNLGKRYLLNLPTKVDLPIVDSKAVLPPPALISPLPKGLPHLTIELIPPKMERKRKLEFSIQPSTDTANQWLIECYHHRSKPNRQNVARLQVIDSELQFEWLAPALQNEKVNYLRNGLLRLRTNSETKVIGLRQPIESASLLVPLDGTHSRNESSLNWLPAPETISVHFEPLAINESDELYYLPLDRTTTIDVPRLVVYLSEKKQDRFVALSVSTVIDRQLNIEASMLINSSTGEERYHLKRMNHLQNQIYAQRDAIAKEKWNMDNYKPVYGEKTKHKKYVKQLKSQLERVSEEAEAFLREFEIAQSLLGLKLRYRVTYEIAGMRLDLAKPPATPPN